MSRAGLWMNASVSLTAAQVDVCQYGLLVLRGGQDLMTGVQGFLFFLHGLDMRWLLGLYSAFLSSHYDSG